MKTVIQRVTEASVTIEGIVHGKIGTGFLLLVGISDEDTSATVRKMADKIAKLRIFEDDAGKMNLSLSQVGGEILSISQFTLYADCRHGNRPSFTRAGSPEAANKLYEHAVETLRNTYGVRVQTGSFGADMKVRLCNDGPFTVLLDSAELGKE